VNNQPLDYTQLPNTRRNKLPTPQIYPKNAYKVEPMGIGKQMLLKNWLFAKNYLLLQRKILRDSGWGQQVPIFYMTPQDQILQYIESLLQGTDAFITQYKALPGNVFKCFIDADTGFDLKRCVSINRQLRKLIDEAALYPDGNYSLEISSPGIDEPLQNIRQYRRNIGRLVEVQYTNAELKPTTGRIKAVSDDELTLEFTDKKSKTTTTNAILFTDIKKATIQIEF
jgi:ribosome maturation factor RimP